jgi:hypothetical protein
MSPTVIYKGKSPEQRIRDRLRNSGGEPRPEHATAQPGTRPTHSVVHSEGPNRTVTNLHHSGSMGGTGNRLGRDNDGSGGGSNGGR